MQENHLEEHQAELTSHRYEPNEDFFQAFEKLEEDAGSHDDYDRRQLEAVFQQGY